MLALDLQAIFGPYELTLHHHIEFRPKRASGRKGAQGRGACPDKASGKMIPQIAATATSPPKWIATILPPTYSFIWEFGGLAEGQPPVFLHDLARSFYSSYCFGDPSGVAESPTLRPLCLPTGVRSAAFTYRV